MNPLYKPWRHLYSGPVERYQSFPQAILDTIEQAIASSETQHSSELRLCVEGGFDLRQILSKITPRERALNLFSELRLWDTEENSGILLYVLVAERKIEIVADRGIARKIEQSIWDGICQEIQAEFKQGRFKEGLMIGIEKLSQLLAQHFPAQTENPNELSNTVVTF